ncbi:aminotransferase class I/II-fold pyridoxal phosphate-dependent enzyme [Haloarcula pelagica]|uniref:aminotransferase class I/II-fold pyridoxal phosphate-dependent enzyme n=1 Tax=Haloarcula pelagica TaxID=3033389 RepID=UPI0024C2F88E|nr:8-amino-7-oxononanoate synthase [Halomicroarcula sp. YJ-61-S]
MSHGFDLAERLRTREDRDLRRHLEVAERVAGRTRLAADPKAQAAEFDEEAVIFASNNYLGLADDSRVQRAAELGARTVGTGAGASRLVTGDTSLHRALERDLADCKGTERALVFSSGYAANVGTIDALDPDVVFSDELNHASIIDGCRVSGAETVVYDHCDVADLRAAMDRRSPAADEQWLVVTDSVFSMDGDVAPVSALCDLTERYGAWLMVDEAHATGLFADGGGIVQRAGESDRVEIQLGTLSKTLASQGGYVAGDEALVEYLLNAARSFVFSTGLAPPSAAAAREALRIARETDRADRLWDRVERLRSGVEEMGYEVLGETHILPVLVGDRDDALALDQGLREYGIVVPAIRPPTVPEGTARLRVAPMATHTDADIRQCLDAFRAAGEEVGLL